MANLGFIGLGVMGSTMVSRLLDKAMRLRAAIAPAQKRNG